VKIFKYIALLLIITSNLQAQKMRLAIMDLNPENVSKPTARMVSEMLRTELFNTGLFRVIERSEMDSILKEQGFQQSGCTETECAVEVGKLLSARKILVGTVGKLGERYIINARIVDVELGEMEFGDRAVADSEGELTDAVVVFADKLAQRITGQRRIIQNKYNNQKKKKYKKETAKNPISACLLSGLFPGVGYYYIGNIGTGILFTSTEIALFACTFFIGYDEEIVKDYDENGHVISETSKVSRGKLNYIIWGALGITKVIETITVYSVTRKKNKKLSMQANINNNQNYLGIAYKFQ